MTLLYKLMSRKWSRVLALVGAGIISCITLAVIWHAFFFFTSGVTPSGKPFKVYKLALRPVYLVAVDKGATYIASDGYLELANSHQIHTIAGVAVRNPDYHGSKISDDSAKHGPARKISRRGSRIVFEDFYYRPVEFEAGR